MNTEDKIYELRDQNATDLHELEKIRGMIEAEKRHLTADEVTRFDALTKSIESRNSEIESIQKTSECLSRMDSIIQDGSKHTETEKRFNAELIAPVSNSEIATRESFGKFLTTGNPSEYRDMNQSVMSEGGFTVAPEFFLQELLRDISNRTVIRGLARVMAMGAFHAFSIPKQVSKLSNFEWTPEVGTIPIDPGLTFSKREMRPHQLSKQVLISERLIANSFLNFQSHVSMELAEALGGTLENCYLKGDGVDKPLGIFTVSANGIDTDRDIKVGAATKKLTYDGLVDAVTMMQTPYLPNAKWLLSRKAIAEIRKLKDNNGRAIWQDQITTREPAVLLGFPIVMTEFLTDDLDDGKYFGCLADFSGYWILDSMGFNIRVLKELYATTSQIGYIGKYWGDGAPVKPNAFVRLVAGA